MKYKAVIFDLDGTLADTLPLCIKAFKQSIEPLIGKSVTEAEIIATFGPSEEGTIAALAPDYYERGMEDYLKYYSDFHSMCATAFEGMEEILRQLRAKGVRIFMVTGKGKKTTDISLAWFKLTDYFELIETGSPKGPRKVHGIQKILNAIPEISKEETIYIGDAPSDIIASRSVGIPVVGAAWAETTDPAKLVELQPDQLFYSIKDFSQWMLANT